jgi:2-amino-4-hydroxy-6-hydroxymethyldihydropteridine diphosphokinase
MSHAPALSIYICLGSNLGDRAGNLLLAVRKILEVGMEVTRLSQIYETEPVETFAQPPFLNMIAEVRGDHAPAPENLMAALLQIEHSGGRTREETKGPRIIDLDLLLHGNQTNDTSLLTLPHPRLHQRRFVLVPLAELAPQLIHPVLNKTVTELLNEVNDNSRVELWQP